MGAPARKSGTSLEMEDVSSMEFWRGPRVYLFWMKLRGGVAAISHEVFDTKSGQWVPDRDTTE